MQRLWSADELGERWTLGPEELKLLAELTGAGKLGLAAQLGYWRQHGRFPTRRPTSRQQWSGIWPPRAESRRTRSTATTGRDAPDAGTAASSSTTSYRSFWP